jgi:hypothetical protein
MQLTSEVNVGTVIFNPVSRRYGLRDRIIRHEEKIQ